MLSATERFHCILTNESIPSIFNPNAQELAKVLFYSILINFKSNSLEQTNSFIALLTITPVLTILFSVTSMFEREPFEGGKNIVKTEVKSSKFIAPESCEFRPNQSRLVVNNDANDYLHSSSSNKGQYQGNESHVNNDDISKVNFTEAKASGNFEQYVPEVTKMDHCSKGNHSFQRMTTTSIDNDRGEQLVPETPLLGNLRAPLLGAGVHRQNSGFAVPETPLFTDSSCIAQDTPTDAPRTPLFKGGLHFQINCYQVPETPVYTTSIVGPRTTHDVSSRNVSYPQGLNTGKSFVSFAHTKEQNQTSKDSSTDVSAISKSTRAYRQQQRATLVTDPMHTLDELYQSD